MDDRCRPEQAHRGGHLRAALDCSGRLALWSESSCPQYNGRRAQRNLYDCGEGCSGEGGGGQTEVVIELPPGEHSLQLLMADHAHVPYGNRPADEVIDLTRAAVERPRRAAGRSGGRGPSARRGAPRDARFPESPVGNWARKIWADARLMRRHRRSENRRSRDRGRCFWPSAVGG